MDPAGLHQVWSALKVQGAQLNWLQEQLAEKLTNIIDHLQI